MAARRRTSRFLANATAVVASTALMSVGCSLIPAGLGQLVLLAASVVAVLLATGWREVAAVRILCRAKDPSREELAILAPAVGRLDRLGLLTPDVEVVVRPYRGLWVSAAGRRTVVVSQGFISASAALTLDQTAALLAHALGQLRLGQTRYDVALAFWALPWRLVQRIGRGVGRASSMVPFVAAAWRLRFVVGAIALVQGAIEGHLSPGALGAAVIAWSYALPWWERRAQLAAEAEADQFVLDSGLGPALASFLRRGPQTPLLRNRTQRVDHCGGRPPGLTLVS